MGLTKNSTGIMIVKDVTKGKGSDLTIALAGNPNVGKSTVFNAMTGLNQHTGNWPGKTVSNALGKYSYKDKAVTVVDLPGTYSLLSDSEEEEIARNYICFENPDIVVVVADATSLERNLNLFLQISEMTDNVILCVNLIDEAEKRNISIDTDMLSDMLNVTVVKTSANKKIGIEELKEKINNMSVRGSRKSKAIIYNDNIEKAVSEIKDLLDFINVSDKKMRWISLRLLEGNEKIVNILKETFGLSKDMLKKIDLIRQKIEEDIKPKSIASEMVKTIIKMAESVSKEAVSNKELYDTKSYKIDKILVSEKFGIPAMILLLIFILWITISLANYPSELLSLMFAKIKEWLIGMLIAINAPLWMQGMIVDGIYSTLTWVVSVMLPPMAIFFPMFTLLEDLGYLPRIAFNLDKSFKKCCSCGKQALTMCMGLGCNAAGIIGCRIINSPKEKLIAILTNVFMPCNGRFPTLITISTVFIAAVLGTQAGSIMAAVIVSAVIVFGVLVTLFVSKILSKTILKGIPSHFILELPPYRKPQIGKILVRSLIDRTLFVLGRAVVVAAPAGIVIWFFANIYIGDISLLTLCANFFEPFAKLIGVDGYIVVAFILGLPANEIVMPILIMSYLRQKAMVDVDSLLGLKDILVSNGWTLLTAINVMILCLMHFPCATTLLTIKRETESIKWTIAAFLIPTVLGIAVCLCTTFVYNIIMI